MIAFGRLAAQQAPDFRSIARFQKRHLSARSNVFLQALELCRSAGMLSLGQVAVDGRKVRTNASRCKAMSYARLTEKQNVFADELSALLADADAIDTAEDTRFGKDKRGLDLPPELVRRECRLVELARARAALEADAAVRRGKSRRRRSARRAMTTRRSRRKVTMPRRTQSSLRRRNATVPTRTPGS